MLAGTPVYRGTDLNPIAWSTDGNAFIVTDGTPGGVIVHVFDKEGLEIWKTRAVYAAWTGPDSVAYLSNSGGTPGRTDLYEMTLPSGTPTRLQGSYLSYVLGAANGRLAVLTSETETGLTFDLLNPVGGHFDGEPVAWSPAGEQLAVITGPRTDLQGDLEIVDATSGSITRTGLVASSDGLAFDHTGKRLIACVFAGQTECTPSLIPLTGGSIVASSMRGELLNAGELPDGQWVGRNAGEVVLWDPRQPAATVDLGLGWPAVSSLGTVAIIGDAPSIAPSLAPLLSVPDVEIVQLAGSGAPYPVWSPTGDRIAYTAFTTSGEELKIATAP